MLGSRLNTIHNLYYYLDLMANIRTAIENNQFEHFAKDFYAKRAG
jgi:queuine tRNA-ribosyltransferase